MQLCTANLTVARLQPLITAHRKIAIHPDCDALEQWSQRCQELGYTRAYISNNLMEHYWQPVDGKKADLADILLRLLMTTLKD